MITNTHRKGLRLSASSSTLLHSVFKGKVTNKQSCQVLKVTESAGIEKEFITQGALHWQDLSLSLIYVYGDCNI